MGMFDYVVCEAPLPDPKFQDTVFQSKSFEDRYMDEYIIGLDRKLYIKVRHFMLNQDYVPLPDEAGALDRHLHAMRNEFIEMAPTREFVPVTTTLQFYDYYADGMVCYEAHFLRGELIGDIIEVERDYINKRPRKNIITRYYYEADGKTPRLRRQNEAQEAQQA
jgi:hypothetical protein